MQFADLIGKTITAADLMKLPRYDDTGWLRLTFSDGTSCVIVSSGDEYTGDSLEEYRQEISIVDHVEGLVKASE